MTAQAVLHRELFHVRHSSLQLILAILRGPWDTLAPPLAGAITCPHLRAQLRGLEASVGQTKHAAYTTLDYTEQLLTTLGLVQITRFDPEHARLIAELHGQTSFVDLRFPSSPTSFPVPSLSLPPPLSCPSSTSLTPTTGPGSLVVTTPPRLYTTTTVPRPAMNHLSTRSRSPSRLTQR